MEGERDPWRRKRRENRTKDEKKSTEGLTDVSVLNRVVVDHTRQMVVGRLI